MAPLLLFILHFLSCPQNIRQPQLKVERVLRLRWAAFGNCSFTFCFHFYFRVFGPSLFLFACLFLCFTLPFTIRYVSVPLAVSVCVCVRVQLVVLVAAPPFLKTKHFVELNSTSKEKPVGVRKSIKATCYFLVPSNRQKWRWFSVATPPSIYCRSHLRSPALFLAVFSVCNIRP